MNSPFIFIHKVSTKLPDDCLSNREFCFLFPEINDSWIEERTGISNRRVDASKNIGTRKAPIESEFKLSVEALEKFQITAKDWNALDAIIVVKSTPIQYSPSLSQKLLKFYSEKFQSENSKNSVFTLDLFQPSTGLLATLKLLQTFPFKNAWIVIPEILTPFINLKDLSSAILFGDGIAAIWLSRDLTQVNQGLAMKIKDVSFESMPDTKQVLGFLDSNESSYMKGPELFRKIIPEFKSSSLKILAKNHLKISDISYYLPHQANSRMIERAANDLGFTSDQTLNYIKDVGNTGCASIPIALDFFLKECKLKQRTLAAGTQILLNACGAGLSRGAAILEVIEERK